MANIVSFGGNAHRQAQLDLPWYATGKLDADERAAVEAHLSNCAACREDLQFERAMAGEVGSLAFDAQPNWSELRSCLHAGARARRWDLQVGELLQRWFAWPGKLGWFLAGQLAAAALILFLAFPRTSPPQYHTLGAPPSYPPGNLIVMFRPEAREADLRAALVTSRATIVEGPTASGAYILRVAAADRDTTLVQLRSRKSVLLAQPIDAESGQ